MDAPALAVKCISILHIDDDPDSFTLTEGLLDPIGVFLTWAADLDAARRELANEKFDAVLLDYAMPDGNGLSFIEEIRGLDPHLPVIVVSGHADEMVAHSSIEKGAVNFVLKPELFRDLIPAIEKALGPRPSWVYRHAMTDLITPWMDPYRPPTPKSGGARFLDQAEIFYRRTLEPVTQGCLVVDGDNVVTFANQALESLSGGAVNRLIGAGLDDLFEERTAEDLRRILEDFQRHPWPQLRRLNGGLRNQSTAAAAAPIEVMISCRPIHDERQVYKGCRMVMDDPGLLPDFGT